MYSLEKEKFDDFTNLYLLSFTSTKYYTIDYRLPHYVIRGLYVKGLTGLLHKKR